MRGIVLSLLAEIALFLLLLCLSLRVHKIILVIEFLMELRADPRELKRLWDIFLFKPCGNFLLKYVQFILHLGVNVSLLAGRPETPKGIAHNISFFGDFFLPEYVVSELLEDVLTLHELLFFFHLFLKLLILHILFQSF
jgi:hypothetical protein